MTPMPADGEPDGLILFDGVCIFCSRWVRFVMERDRAGRFRFLPIQSDRGRALAARIGLDPDNPRSHALIRNGKALFRSSAALGVLTRLPGWRAACLVRFIPAFLLDALYEFVARNRYNLFGRSDVCWMPDPARRERFLS